MTWAGLVSKLIDVTQRHFGEGVTYGADDISPAITINAIFCESYEAIDPNSGAIVASNTSKIAVDLEELPRAPKHGDTVVAQGRTYSVIDIQNDENGAVDLILHRASS